MCGIEAKVFSNSECTNTKGGPAAMFFNQVGGDIWVKNQCTPFMPGLFFVISECKVDESLIEISIFKDESCRIPQGETEETML